MSAACSRWIECASYDGECGNVSNAAPTSEGEDVDDRRDDRRNGCTMHAERGVQEGLESSMLEGLVAELLERPNALHGAPARACAQTSHVRLCRVRALAREDEEASRRRLDQLVDAAV